MRNHNTRMATVDDHGPCADTSVYKPAIMHNDFLILTLKAQAPSCTWACGPWGPSIARRPCPQRVSVVCMCLWCMHFLNIWLVPPRPLWLGGPYFLPVCRANPNLKYNPSNLIFTTMSMIHSQYGPKYALKHGSLCVHHSSVMHVLSLHQTYRQPRYHTSHMSSFRHVTTKADWHNKHMLQKYLPIECILPCQCTNKCVTSTLTLLNTQGSTTSNI